MGLISCPECNREVSDVAANCPGCGYPISQNSPRAQSQPFAAPPYYSPPQQTTRPYQPMPPTYMAQAILVTLFCCLPFGIVAIVKAASVSTSYGRGDYELAKRQSDEAWSWVANSMITWLALFAIYIVVVIIASVGSR